MSIANVFANFIASSAVLDDMKSLHKSTVQVIGQQQESIRTGEDLLSRVGKKVASVKEELALNEATANELDRVITLLDCNLERPAVALLGALVDGATSPNVDAASVRSLKALGLVEADDRDLTIKATQDGRLRVEFIRSGIIPKPWLDRVKKAITR